MLTVQALRATAVDYHVALQWQRETAAAVRAGGPEAVALIEHTSVYTMGARGGRATVLAPIDALPAPLVDTDRGGDITWHGPGQLVAYPILGLRRRGLGAVQYVRLLEATLIDTLAAFGLEAATIEGRPGVWARGAKVAAIGVRIQGGVSLHGIALNVAPDLRWYDAIVPCGIADAGATSIERLLGAAPAMDEAIEAFCSAFERRFGVSFVGGDTAPLQVRGDARTSDSAASPVDR